VSDVVAVQPTMAAGAEKRQNTQVQTRSDRLREMRMEKGPANQAKRRGESWGTIRTQLSSDSPLQANGGSSPRIHVSRKIKLLARETTR